MVRVALAYAYSICHTLFGKQWFVDVGLLGILIMDSILTKTVSVYEFIKVKTMPLKI